MSVKLLYDTDIGTDLDDAMSLAYLLAQPACELLGITTVTGEAHKRAMLADILCKRAGKNVPIFPGAETPLLLAQKQRYAEQASEHVLTTWEHEDFKPGKPIEAIKYLQDTIRQYPGEIILLATGPLTNLGLLFSLDPEIPALLKGLVLMCGNFTHRIHNIQLEWNALVDPHATAIVYQARVPQHRSLGIDVTYQTEMTVEAFRQYCEKIEALRPLLDFAREWFTQTEKLYFHDPLAAAVIFDEEICRFSRGKVEVEVASESRAGFTYWLPLHNGPHEVALDIHIERFFEHYFQVVGSEIPTRLQARIPVTPV